MTTLLVTIELANQNNNLFLFMGEINRLSAQNKSFILGWKGGNKLFLETCKGLQRNAYVCPVEKEKNEAKISTLNYAIALEAHLQLLLISHKLLVFKITSQRYAKIIAFANAIGAYYDVVADTEN